MTKTNNTEKKSKVQGRRWLITINNPLEKGWTHDAIKVALNRRKASYFCMADEQGNPKADNTQGTFHTHIFVCFPSPRRFDTLKSEFPESHLDKAMGGFTDNYNYVTKTGKWSDSDKRQTVIEGSFEECGERPAEHEYPENLSAQLYAMLRDGLTDAEILASNPNQISKVNSFDRVRQIITNSSIPKWRNVKCYYLYGPTGCGKTSYCLNKHPDAYRVISYNTGAFDFYKGEKCLILDEFRSQLDFSLFLNLIDSHKMQVSARYNNKYLCADTIWILSNWPLSKQYDYLESSDRDAMYRRITNVYYMSKQGDLYPDATFQITKNSDQHTLFGGTLEKKE